MKPSPKDYRLAAELTVVATVALYITGFETLPYVEPLPTLFERNGWYAIGRIPVLFGVFLAYFWSRRE